MITTAIHHGSRLTSSSWTAGMFLADSWSGSDFVSVMSNRSFDWSLSFFLDFTASNVGVCASSEW